MQDDVNRLSKDERRQVLKQFAEHISGGQIAMLKAGHLDLIEGERRGARFTDAVSGRPYFDAFAAAGCFNVGRGNPEIIATLKEAADAHDMGSYNLLSPHKVEFAKKLVSLSPGDLNRIIFSCGGGEAIESALKLAMGATGRDEIIGMVLAYHGHSGFSLSAGGKEYYRQLFEPLAPEFRFAPFNDLEAMKRMTSDKTAAIILEPVQGEGGIHVATDDYLKGLRELCDELGFVLIFDEIQTGFGRTGKLWFCEHSGVVPDIMVLAKSIGGGMYPNAAIVYRDTDLLTGYVDKNPSFHASCGGGSDVGCAVGLKALEYIVDNKIPENAARQGARIKNALTEIMNRNPRFIKDVRGIGMMLAIEYKYKFMGSLMADCLSMNSMFAAYSGNAPQVMRFMLAPTMTDAEVDEALDAINRAVKRMKQQGGFLALMSKIPPVGKLLDDDKFMIRLGNWVRGG